MNHTHTHTHKITEKRSDPTYIHPRSIPQKKQEQLAARAENQNARNHHEKQESSNTVLDVALIHDDDGYNNNYDYYGFRRDNVYELPNTAR